jgi:hypothetical protein
MIRIILIKMSLVLVAVVAFSAPARSDASIPGLTLTVAGPPADVFVWKRDACDPDDIPDAPARAFRDADGAVHLLATHFTNRASVGPELDRVRHDCRVLLRSGNQPHPEMFDDRSWLAAVYTADGRNVTALVHDEFQGHRHASLCSTGRYIDCWYNAITMAVSRDGGASFALLPPRERVVAALPYPYERDRRKHVGYFNPTNILAADGFLYAMVFAEPVGRQKHGSCLMRTPAIDDPRAWRAWDGAGFSISFTDPYTAASGGDAGHVCEPVGKGKLRWPVTSISRHRSSGLYVALMMGVTEGASPQSGVFYSVSRDLIEWAEPRLLLGAPMPSRYACGDAAPLAYPSLLDPASPGRNFDAVSDRAELFVTRFNIDGCKIGMDRDLIRIPVGIRAIGSE